jgi:hypothetical protein
MRGYRATVEESADANFPIAAWGTASALGVGGSILLAVLLPQSAVNVVSFIFGGAGLVVSVLGFGFTIWQLRRTQKATGAATEALDKARREFSSLDVLAELHAAKSNAEGTREHLLGKRWIAAAAGYDRVRDRLMRIIAAPEQLSSDESDEAKDFIAHTLGASGDLEQLKDGEDFDASSLRGRLKELENFTLRIEYRIKDALRGS